MMMILLPKSIDVSEQYSQNQILYEIVDYNSQVN